MMVLARAWFALGACSVVGTDNFGFDFGTTIGGAISNWPLNYSQGEMLVWNYTISTPNGQTYGAYLDHFWSAGGTGPIGTYIADRQIVRYYVDGEENASIVFEPAMASGSGIGWERLGYYEKGLNLKEPWGPEMSNDLMGHGAASGGGWHNRFKVPFSKKIRITVQLPLDIPSNSSQGMFMIVRGLEGDPRPLSVGTLSLPPTVPWRLRLRKFQVRQKHVQPQQYVNFSSWESKTAGPRSGGALLLTVFVAKPGPLGDDQRRLKVGVMGGAWEGCFRAYTERSGPNSKWPGVLLATGTEDYYDSAYTFRAQGLDTGRPFYGADAGFSHKSQLPHGVSSFYRLHHNDPLYFRGKFALVWRDGSEVDAVDGHRKCIHTTGDPSGVPYGGSPIDLTVDSWVYTWEDPSLQVVV